MRREINEIVYKASHEKKTVTLFYWFIYVYKIVNILSVLSIATKVSIYYSHGGHFKYAFPLTIPMPGCKNIH